METFGPENSVNWNHNNSIINRNSKSADSSHVNPNHSNSNKLNPVGSTKIGIIHYFDDFCEIKKILASQVNSLLHTSPIFTSRSTSEPLSPPHDSLAESVTPKGNPKPHNNPPNPIPNVQSDQKLNPSLSDYSLSDLSYSSDDKYYKQNYVQKRGKKTLD